MIQSLTSREIDVLRRAPCSNKEIGLMLGISSSTVGSHFAHIAVKLRTWVPQGSGMRNRYRSLLVALKADIITLDEVVMRPQFP